MQRVNHISDITAIGVDIGGTKILAGQVSNGNIVDSCKVPVPKDGSEADVLNACSAAIDGVFNESISGIGVGVPSVVDVERGIVYDVQNIPSWKEVHLKSHLEERYGVPVYLNNDANCFAIGEKYFGKGQGYKDVVALIVGTGLAAGIIVNGQLYNGSNCGAGEIGMIPYLDKHYEYYCCGQYFENVHNVKGEELFERAHNGDAKAIDMFRKFGSHLGLAINTVLYAYDPEVIILGGSVSKAYPYYEETMWASIRKLVYKPVIDNITIETSARPDIAVLGAAALYFDSRKESSHYKLESSEIK